MNIESNNSNNVLVTGATGFVGREIVSELINDGYKVFQLGNRQANFPVLNIGKTEFLKADITDYRNFAELEKLKGIKTIVHLAGLAHQFGKIERAEFFKINVNGTKNILKLAVLLKIRHFILISSTAVYGTKKKKGTEVEIIDESADCHPQTYYAESKLQAERIAENICGENGIDLTIFRLSPVIGEGNTGNVARMIAAIDKNRFLWIGKGENYKSLIYKKDVAAACACVIKNKKTGAETFNLAAEPILMSDFVDRAAKILGKKLPRISIPPILLERIFQFNEKFFRLEKITKTAVTVEKWLSDDVYAASKFAREYDFEPSTEIAEALRKQISVYLGRKEKT